MRATQVQSMRKMAPGTLGGQSWSATPAAARPHRTKTTGFFTTVITPTMDTYIDSENLTSNFSSVVYVIIGMPYGTGHGAFGRKMLANWDITPFADFIVTTAPLTLTVESSIGGGSNRGEHPHLQARRVLPAQTSAATFETYDGTHNWGVDGARDDGVDSASIYVNGTDEMLTENPGDTYHVDCARLINQALGAGLSELRILVCSDSFMANSNPIFFASSRHSTTAWRPYMTVTASTG